MNKERDIQVRYTVTETFEATVFTWHTLKITAGRSDKDFVSNRESFEKLFQAISYLENKLGAKHIRNYRSFLCKRLSSAATHFKAKSVQFNYDILVILRIAKMLETLELHNIDAFRYLNKRIRKELNSEAWQGTAFELDVAQTFAKKGFDFIMLEGYSNPDIKLKHFTSEIFIELTTVMKNDITLGKSSAYKVSKAIREKSKKPYSNRNTVLFIEISNFIYHQIVSGVDDLEDDTEIKNALQNHSFGAIVLRKSYIDSECGSFLDMISVYLAYPHKEATAAVSDFMKVHYPKTERKSVEPFALLDTHY